MNSVILEAKRVYEENGKNAWVNPGSEKKKKWNGRYIDVIATKEITSDSAWVMEVETEDSVSANEAVNQWTDYDQAYQPRWYLAVPKESKISALALLKTYNIKHCELILWSWDADGTADFSKLPGL